MHQKDLCPGAQNCPEVLTVEPDAAYTALPCDGCPQQALRNYLVSPDGQLIQAVIDLDFALQAGITIPLSAIPYPDFLLLRTLMEERNRRDLEEMQKKSKR
jgi:hypothetical protein